MNKLIVSSSPHVRSNTTTSRIMLDVVIALLPTAIMGCLIFGLRALLTIGVCCASAVLAELVFNLIVKKQQTITDFSALVTGLILALNLRADAPVWQCVIGSVFAIIVVKCLFGGLGCNFANPAATARIFMLLCFSGSAVIAGTSTGIGGGATPNPLVTIPGVELVSGATPLAVLGGANGELPSMLSMLLGYRGGAIGEACIAAIAIGFIYLVVRRVIHFETPLIYVGTVFVFYLIATNSFVTATYEIMAGGLVFASVFMITDYVSTPITRTGKMIFAFGCGLITFLIRYFGALPEGVSYSILIMNIISPYIEKWTQKKPLGGKSV